MGRGRWGCEIVPCRTAFSGRPEWTGSAETVLGRAGTAWKGRPTGASVYRRGASVRQFDSERRMSVRRVVRRSKCHDVPVSMGRVARARGSDVRPLVAGSDGEVDPDQDVPRGSSFGDVESTGTLLEAPITDVR